MKYDFGWWCGGGEQGAEQGMAPDDPFENHQDHVYDGPSQHHRVARVYAPGEHTATSMSSVADDYLKLLG
jgi:hypothetical protein